MAHSAAYLQTTPSTPVGDDGVGLVVIKSATLGARCGGVVLYSFCQLLVSISHTRMLLFWMSKT